MACKVILEEMHLNTCVCIFFSVKNICRSRQKKPVITSVIDEVVHDGSVKTTTVQSFDPCRKVFKKQSPKTRRLRATEPKAGKITVKRNVSAAEGSNIELNSGIVIDMQYSRLQVNKTKGTKKSSLVTKTAVQPVKELISSPTYSDWSTANSNNRGEHRTWTPERNSYPDTKVSYISLWNTNSYENDSHFGQSPLMDSITCSDYSPSNVSESSDVYRARNYITPVKSEVLGINFFCHQ